MRKKVIVISILVLVAILIISLIFITQIMNSQITSNNNIQNENIINPDRIVYKTSENVYYEFLAGTEEYKEIIEIVNKSIENYNENGTILTDEEIDKVHEGEFIEYDYNTVSKNYIISFDEYQKNKMIKLADTGGRICVEKVNNINNLQRKIKQLTTNKKAQRLEYKEMISRNVLNTFEYKYQQQFKEINYKIHQKKIQDMETYERYKAMCKLAFDEEITEDIFKQNDLILTVTMVPKITVKVNIGNIKYTYENIENTYMQYTCHLLIVSKIVNTDCIYNKDMSTLEQQVQSNNISTEYDKQVENLNKEIFVTDFDEFINQYENMENKNITKEQAEEIAEKGFEEAKRICGEYDKSTQEIKEKNMYANNFFTRKISQRDDVYNKKSIQCYLVSRQDEMGNGVTIYIDKKTGKIVGGEAYGD